MRALYVIGVIGTDVDRTVVRMMPSLPGIPMADHGANTADIITALMNDQDELLESGLNDLADALRYVPLVVYVRDFLPITAEAITGRYPEATIIVLACEQDARLFDCPVIDYRRHESASNLLLRILHHVRVP
jgi:hypothetical protein